MSKIKSCIGITMLLILCSCNGQKNKHEIKQATSSEKKLEERKPATYYTESFVHYSDDDQISQVVRTIFQDSQGAIWFGGEGGAYRLSNNSLTHIKGIKDSSGGSVTVKDIAGGNDGKIWIGHSDGISCVDGEIVTNYYESDGLISNDVWCIAIDSTDKVWIGTIAGVCVFNGQEFKKFDLPEGKVDPTLGISSTRMVHSIYEDSNGTLWLSSNAGLFSYANNSLTNVSKKAGIQTNFINETFEDKNGELWVSTKNGLYKLTDGKAENITEGKIETGKGIGSIAEDKDGTIWFVSNQHSLFRYNREKIVEYKKTQNNKGPVVFQIFKDQSDRLWFVGFGGVFRLENGVFINVTKNGPW